MYAPLAQLDRVCGYEPQGQGFESLTARQRDAVPNSFWVQRYFFVLFLDSWFGIFFSLSLHRAVPEAEPRSGLFFSGSESPALV